MKISISATNPCHLYPMASELAKLGALGRYYSGYPRWKLPDADAVPMRTNSLRTNIVYASLRLPPWARPAPHRLFTWQDRAFDRWAGRALEACDFIHAMPGQALHTFRRARALGVRTVLNHATGPVREVLRIMEPEYRRAGLRMEDHSPFDAEYFAREDEEHALADFHCAASRIVRGQLVREGVAAEKIVVVPYGADMRIFHPAPAMRERDALEISASPRLRVSASSPFRIVYAGQVCLRKDIRTLLAALKASGRAEWRVDFFGGVAPEIAGDLAAHGDDARLHFHGAVSQSRLADAFRAGSVLVLPSLEEGFGLVVPQALNCGLPCVVSDRVGALDLVRHHANGSVFPAGDPAALLAELEWWESHGGDVAETFAWDGPARTLLEWSASR